MLTRRRFLKWLRAARCLPFGGLAAAKKVLAENDDYRNPIYDWLSDDEIDRIIIETCLSKKNKESE